MLEIVSESNGRVNFIIFYQEQEKDNIKEIDEPEAKIPLKDLKVLYKESNEIEKEIEKQKERLFLLTKYFQLIENEILAHEDILEYNFANASLLEKVDGKVLIINGWIPFSNLSKIEKFLQNEDIAYITEDPSEKDDVPILLKNGPFSKLFEPITVGKFSWLPP